MNVKVGDTVWFHSYSGVDSGTVIDIIEKDLRSTKIACIKHSDSFTTVEIDSRKMWETRQEATLVLAEKKQQDAARLLSEAADLFKRAGGMKEDVAVAAE
jgi:hypothetical protein